MSNDSDPQAASDTLWANIESIDLGPIRFKLLNDDHGGGWSRELVELVEPWYRRFLFLNAKYHKTGRAIVPNRLIDEFWHTHILDTEKYEADCIQTIGYFLHHFPYFGMRGSEDATNLATSFSDTMELYEAEFGERPDFTASLTGAHAADCANACGSPCSTGGDESYSMAWRPTA